MGDFSSDSQEDNSILIDLCFPEPPAAGVTLKDLATGEHQVSAHSTVSHCKTKDIEGTDF